MSGGQIIETEAAAVSCEWRRVSWRFNVNPTDVKLSKSVKEFKSRLENTAIDHSRVDLSAFLLPLS